MKTNPKLILFLCGALTLPGIALAQDDEQDARQRRPGPPPVPPIFRALDKDKDGTLSEAEIKATPDVLLKLDIDGDGQVTRREIAEFLRENRPERPLRPDRPDRPERPIRPGNAERPNRPERANRPDRPQNAERPFAMAPVMFRLFDTDRDGVLSAAEIDASVEILSAMDKDGDGQISMREFRAAMPPPPRRPRGERNKDRDQDEGSE